MEGCSGSAVQILVKCLWIIGTLNSEQNRHVSPNYWKELGNEHEHDHQLVDIQQGHEGCVNDLSPGISWCTGKQGTSKSLFQLSLHPLHLQQDGHAQLWPG